MALLEGHRREYCWVHSARVLLLRLFLTGAKGRASDSCVYRLGICCQSDHRGFAGILADTKLGDDRSHHKHVWDSSGSDVIRMECKAWLVHPKGFIDWFFDHRKRRRSSVSSGVVNARMASCTESDQILFGIVPGLAAKLFVVDFKVGHCAARLASPAV